MIKSSMKQLAFALVVMGTSVAANAQSVDVSKLGTTLTPMGAEKTAMRRAPFQPGTAESPSQSLGSIQPKVMPTRLRQTSRF